VQGQQKSVFFAFPPRSSALKESIQTPGEQLLSDVMCLSMGRSDTSYVYQDEGPEEGVAKKEPGKEKEKEKEPKGSEPR